LKIGLLTPPLHKVVAGLIVSKYIFIIFILGLTHICVEDE